MFTPEKGVPLGPKGGNHAVAGMHQPKAGDPDKFFVGIVDSTSTLSNSKQLLVGTELHSTFWLFVPVWWYFPAAPGVKAPNVMCLGLWYFDAITNTSKLNQCSGVGRDGKEFTG